MMGLGAGHPGAGMGGIRKRGGTGAGELLAHCSVV